MDNPLVGKAAFVTGGSKGIGRAICLGLARAGAAVALTGRSQGAGPGTARSTASRIEDEGGRALALVCDVRNSEAVQSAIGNAVAALGRLDILVNNAGLYFPGFDAVEIELPSWQETIDTHINGSFLCARFAVPFMAAGGGSIINISSTAGDPGHDSTGNLAYAVAKAGMEQFTRGLARELAKDNIAVNAIRPMALVSEGSERNRDWLARYRSRRADADAPASPNEARDKPFSDPSAIVPAIVHLAQCRGEFSGNVVRRTDYENGAFRDLVWNGSA